MFPGRSVGRFLSTPSARRATTTILTALRHLEKFLSTPSARRATDFGLAHIQLLGISIHALREEGDCSSGSKLRAYSNFYPRPPRGGRPGQRHCADHLQNFYPRPPRGGRPATALHRGKAAVFLSTPSARRATFWRFRNGLCDEISIHALREEGDMPI